MNPALDPETAAEFAREDYARAIAENTPEEPTDD